MRGALTGRARGTGAWPSTRSMESPGAAFRPTRRHLTLTLRHARAILDLEVKNSRLSVDIPDCARRESGMGGGSRT